MDFVSLHADKELIKKRKTFVQLYFVKVRLKLKKSKTKICFMWNAYENLNFSFEFFGFSLRQYRIGKDIIWKTKAFLIQSFVCLSKVKVIENWKIIKKFIKNVKNTAIFNETDCLK